MLHRPIPSRKCYSALTISLRSLGRLLRLVLLLGLLLLLLQSQLGHLPGQSSQQESAVCTFQPRPVLEGVSSTPEDDLFGRDTFLSLDGTIAAIGARSYYDSSGHQGYVQVYRFENKAWTPLGSTILGENSTETYTSANALSDDGLILAVGGVLTTNVQVFRFVDDDWEPLGNDIRHQHGETIGRGLTISGDGTILAASSARYGNIGEILVFEWVGDTWSQKGRTLQGVGEEQNFGESLSLSHDGSVLALGRPNDSDDMWGQKKGYVQVFEFIDNDWVQIGQTLQGPNVGDEFGRAVSLSSDGRTLAIGRPFYSDGNSIWLGSVHVYRFGRDGQWFEPGSMLIGKTENKQFGRSLALSGDASMLVASGDGILRIFESNGHEWIEVWEEATDSQSSNAAAISRDGSTAMGGAIVVDISCQQGTMREPVH